ncbi:MAG: hypothetical protein ACSHX4_04085 [Opitutaceae bacterium]
MQGFAKFWRKFFEWEWYQDANTARVFFHLIMVANHKDSHWRGHVVKRGQTITGTHKLATILKIPRGQIRTALKNLQMTNEITIRATNLFSVITICNYDAYQDRDATGNQPVDKPTASQPANEQPASQPTSDHQTTTNKNDKNDKEEKNEKKVERHLQLFLSMLENFGRNASTGRALKATYRRLLEYRIESGFPVNAETVRRDAEYCAGRRTQHRKWNPPLEEPPPALILAELMSKTIAHGKFTMWYYDGTFKLLMAGARDEEIEPPVKKERRSAFHEGL